MTKAPPTEQSAPTAAKPTLADFAKRLRQAKREYFADNPETLIAITPFDSIAYDMERAALEASPPDSTRAELDEIQRSIYMVWFAAGDRLKVGELSALESAMKRLRTLMDTPNSNRKPSEDAPQKALEGATG